MNLLARFLLSLFWCKWFDHKWWDTNPFEIQKYKIYICLRCGQTEMEQTAMEMFKPSASRAGGE